MSAAPAARTRRPERELLEAVAAVLRGRGYRTYLDPDGTDYFDLAARRGEEVGLVEGKVAGARQVLGQAIRRRAWADWVAVAVPSERAAARLVALTASRRSEIVGVWACGPGGAREIRPAAATHDPDGADPFAPTRARLRQQLLDLDDGVLHPGVRWSSVPSAVRRASAGRSFSEWRLDEPTADRP